MKRLLLGLLIALVTPAYAVEYRHVERPGEVVVRAVIGVGMLDSCGYREAPHLIEHLLLSETRFGDTAADLMVSLNRYSVDIEAVTRQDFTEYVLRGPASSAEIIEEAAVAILARPQLPSSGFESEIDAILLELNADGSYVSRGSYFEQYGALHHGIPGPCPDDSIPLKKYSHAKVQSIYDAFYVSGNISLLSVGPASGLDISRIAAEIEDARPALANVQRYEGERLSMNTIHTAQFAGTLEVLFAIPGRDTLPHYLAQQLAESARLELQAHLRKVPIAYQARSVLHQSLQAGWISLTAVLGSEIEEVDVNTIKGHVLNAVNEHQFTLSDDRFALVSNFDLALSPQMFDRVAELSYTTAVLPLAEQSIAVSHMPHRRQARNGGRNYYLLLGILGLGALVVSIVRRRK